MIQSEAMDMTRPFLFALVALPALSLAQEEASLNPVQKDMALQRELNDVLKDITDRESADAAAPRVKELGEALNLNIEAIMKYVRDHKEEAKAAFVEMRKDVEFIQACQGWTVRVDALRQLNPPCYGSTALREALKEVKSEKK